MWFKSLNSRDSFFIGDEIDKERETLIRQKISVVLLGEPEYPELLSHIYDPPPLLFVKGELPSKDILNIAVVGSRNPTPYGVKMAEQLGYDLALAGVTVVSGMARGIDSAAHRGALKAGGKTIAVLGTGIDIVYPKENLRLAGEIEQNGVLVSEFPLGTKPLKGNFPRRNRVISGMSHGVVVVEARKKSGALITADFALEQGREVFAVPGRADLSASFGTHKLLRDGAKLVERAEDIIEEFPQLAANHSTLTGQNAGGARRTKNKNESKLDLGKEINDKETQEVLSLLANGVDLFDDIVLQIGGGPGNVERILLKLEMDGTIKRLPGSLYMLATSYKK